MTFFPSSLSGNSSLNFFVAKRTMGLEQWLANQRVLPLVYSRGVPIKAFYTHCTAHRLNLCVMRCCEIREVGNMMDTTDKISRFFNNSPKRQLALEKWIENVLPQEEQRRKLKELCGTQWVECHEAFQVFSDLFSSIFACLEAIAHSPPANWNRETRSDAQSFLLAMSQFPFIVSLVFSRKILGYTRGLSVKLQGRFVDIVCAHQDIE